MNLSKYNELFTGFGVDQTSLESSYNKWVSEKGDNEKANIQFITGAFDDILRSYKSQIRQREQKYTALIGLYNKFIPLLDEDQIDSSKYRKQLAEVSHKLSNIKEDKATRQYSNTKYGKRKQLDQLIEHRANLSAEERKKFDATYLFWFVLIVVITCILLYAFGGFGAVLKWMQR